MITLHDRLRTEGLSKYKVLVCTKDGAYEFPNFNEAKNHFPTLDPFKNTHDFTWAMSGVNNTLRFEDWETEEMMSH